MINSLTNKKESATKRKNVVVDLESMPFWILLAFSSSRFHPKERYTNFLRMSKFVSCPVLSLDNFDDFSPSNANELDERLNEHLKQKQKKRV